MLVSEELSSSGGSGKYSYNNPDYENVERSSKGNTRNAQGAVSRSGSAASSQFESMFGMARRFPSIRLKGSAKKEAKRAATLQGEWLIMWQKINDIINCLTRNISIW